jgi:hypothetical protein
VYVVHSVLAGQMHPLLELELAAADELEAVDEALDDAVDEAVVELELELDDADDVLVDAALLELAVLEATDVAPPTPTPIVVDVEPCATLLTAPPAFCCPSR